MTWTKDEEFRARAAAEAAEELKAAGFVRSESGDWLGELDVTPFGRRQLQVSLPPDFPFRLPLAFVEEGQLAQPIPHVEAHGKVCLAPETGILLDTSNPRGIIAESLSRARTVLLDGLAGKNSQDYFPEFTAYWNRDATTVMYFIASPDGRARIMAASPVGRGSLGVLIAENDGAARSWLSRLGNVPGPAFEVFFLPLAFPFEMPPSQPTTREMRSLIQRSAEGLSYRCLLSWMSQRHLPTTVVVSFALKDGTKAVFALRFERPWWNFTSNRRALWEWMLSDEQPVTKIMVHRLDPAFLLPRGGASINLLNKVVAIIGCGAVGSRVAEHLAASGVGRLRLVDPDALGHENVYRHPLGFAHLRANKAKGMERFLRGRFPHLRVESRDQSAEVVLRDDRSFLLSADLIVIAIGEETAELRLNDLLARELPVIHTWLEPLGVGGHALFVAPVPARGCYRCLFSVGAEGLANRASFARSGQAFQRTHAACQGNFTPYGEMDADRTAIEASRLCLQALAGTVTRSVLVSWFGDPSHFSAEGFALSQRASLFQPGEMRHEYNFAATGCSGCRN